MELERLSLDDPSWAAFVAGHPQTTPFHDPAWAQMLVDCYGLDGFALVDRDQTGTLTAGLPVVAAPRLPRGGRRLVALPYTDFVRPLVEATHEATLADSLDAARRRLGFDRLELRTALAGARRVRTHAVIHTLELESDTDAVFARLTKGKRRDVRAAQRSGLTVRRAERDVDVTQTYFDLHLHTRRRLGVPSQPKRLFRLLWERLIEPGGGFVLLAEERGVAVAGAVFLAKNRTVVYKYSASDRSAATGPTTDLLLWDAIESACRGGFTTFDFGRSELEALGLRRFKDRWGAAEQPLDYSVLGDVTAGEAAPARGGGLVAHVLRRAPIWMTRVSGELLYRYAA
jgi:CelD/BcsL family acetyltransferase involved in cellulose biosynthesis